MSGGKFDYNQFNIKTIAEDIRYYLDKQGKVKDTDELFMSDDFYEKYPDEKYHYKHPNDVNMEMEKAIRLLEIAYIYAHRIDYLLSGDDSDESFLSRLKEDLDITKDSDDLILVSKSKLKEEIIDSLSKYLTYDEDYYDFSKGYRSLSKTELSNEADDVILKI